MSEIINYKILSNNELLNILVSGCKFKYFSYDHKKALEEYNTNDEFSEDRIYFPNPDCWDMPNKLKEKFKVERIGKLRKIYFAPNGNIQKFEIGAKYAKTFTLNDIGVSVFPLTEINYSISKLNNDIYKFLNNISINVGDKINEYHWRECCGLMKQMKENKLIL